MKVENDYSLLRGDDFDSGQWVHVTDDQSPHPSPLNDFNGFYMPSSSHPALDSFYSRPVVTSHASNPPLYPLIVPQWPSQLTNPSISPPTSTPQSSSSAPILTPRPIAPSTTPIEPISAIQSAPPVPTPIPVPQSGRRTLTDQDRQRMCQYHEDNPTVKQTEIGAIFGVERSTVSKVLRHKEKYLHPEDGSRSPIKRSKGKFPDIERAVSNWAKNHQRQGLPLSNEMIRDKARIFANTVGSSDCITKVNTSVWLEHFKQKNGLLGARPPDSSEVEDSEMAQTLDPPSGSQTPHGLSPTSPTEQQPTSPDQETETSEGASRFRDPHSTFRRTHSESNNPHASYFPGSNLPSTFSPNIRSPTSPYFSPVSSCGPSPSIQSQAPRLPTLAPADSRPRRQTFPTITPPTSTTSTEPPLSTSKAFQQSMTASALESPLEEMEDSSFDIDSPMHNTSNILASNNINRSSIALPPNPPLISTSTSPIINNTSTPTITPSPSSATSSAPSPDEARRALEIVMSFFHASPTPLDPQDYITMGKLMEKLKLRGYELPGGMRAMMEATGARRKRSIHALS
ncbi:MAG: hypothetical protein LQ350_007024 [Teloschistes chrysophthalmus]|nr:MAG: hypothetical protein LQ350_007024 [Niorma chrysophthalma]